MTPDDLKYKSLTDTISPYAVKGRTESANFLNWLLEHIYRLDDVAADDAICDQSNDKGIDGIYVDHNSEEIHFFSCKIRQNDKGTVGDVALKNLAGSLDQFKTAKSIADILSGFANDDLKRILISEGISLLVESGYSTRGILVTNEELDDAARDYNKIRTDIDIYDRGRIAMEFIDLQQQPGINDSFEFAVDYVEPMQFSVGKDVDAFVFPAMAGELVKLKGISDGALFSQNVRLALGATPVNKAIAESVGSSTEHRNFPLFHNGIILLCDEARLDAGKLTIHNYVVVNGAQSLTTFYRQQDKITNDLRVLVKVIRLNDSALARKITEYSNNQNAIKPRDLRSNHDLMLRLQSEFEKHGGEFSFEIKRGEQFDDSKIVISNDLAGRMLLAFDIGEPYSCHQIYRVFDEKYADIFGRKEVDCYRIIFLWRLMEMVKDHLPEIESKAFASYGLTKFFLLNIISRVIALAKADREIVRRPGQYWGTDQLKELYVKIDQLLSGLVVDLNYEVKAVGDKFDYKADFKSPAKVEEWANKLLRNYEKDVARGKAVAFA